jgi:hypothetical protein
MPNVSIKPFAKFTEIEQGDLIKVDAGFSCIRPYAKRIVSKNKSGLYFACDAGKHYLAGQIQDKDGALVGIYKCS